MIGGLMKYKNTIYKIQSGKTKRIDGMMEHNNKMSHDIAIVA